MGLWFGRKDYQYEYVELFGVLDELMGDLFGYLLDDGYDVISDKPDRDFPNEAYVIFRRPARKAD
jgi:hypothetical protein